MRKSIQTKILNRAANAPAEEQKSRRAFYPVDLMPEWIEQFLARMNAAQLNQSYQTSIIKDAKVLCESADVSFSDFFRLSIIKPQLDNGTLAFDTTIDRDPGLNVSFLTSPEWQYAYRAFARQPELYMGAALWFASLFCLAYDIGNNPANKKPTTFGLRAITDEWKIGRHDFSQRRKYNTAQRYLSSTHLLLENIFKDPQQIAGAIAVLAKSKHAATDDVIVVTEADINSGVTWFYEKGAFRSSQLMNGNTPKCPARMMLIQTARLPLYKATTDEATALVHCIRKAKTLIDNDRAWRNIAYNVINTSLSRAAL